MAGCCPANLQNLVMLRASQINGCGWCTDVHSKDAVHAGEDPVRLALVAAWRESSVFSDAERAALELTEQGTRIADGAGGVSDEAWANAAAHFDEGAARRAPADDRADQRRQSHGCHQPPGRRHLRGRPVRAGGGDEHADRGVRAAAAAAVLDRVPHPGQRERGRGRGPGDVAAVGGLARPARVAKRASSRPS